ncbi:hypothetical protein [Flavihumibacter fluvii]|uniref:hypothetical protein n=1 Tax=Flavihumibacter fluvii TaxID=2838157 RepID=UPI001BDF1797|nr:hypothetical protein [Flavihumibacter fluvii]ULQ54731.1 hypothetical protein KJS93_10415 [Flavihumibacter fluvii]
MTVNERLSESSMLDLFYTAVEEKNVQQVMAIFKQMELTDSSITDILISLGFKYPDDGNQ